MPLVQALLDAGSRYGEIVEVVDDALYEAGLREGQCSDAKLKRRTGLSSAQIGRARSRQSRVETPTLAYKEATCLVGRWLSEPGYVSKGSPRPLPLHGERSFTELASMAGLDPQVALSELKRVGAIRVSRGRVSLLTNGYVPRRGLEERLDILGRDGAEFIETMLHNVRSKPASRMLQRKASYDNIGSGALSRVREILNKEAQRALMKANAMLAAADRDRSPKGSSGWRNRVSFGVYSFHQPVATSRSPRKGKTGRDRSS